MKLKQRKKFFIKNIILKFLKKKNKKTNMCLFFYIAKFKIIRKRITIAIKINTLTAQHPISLSY